jgi:hypothetical protein
MLKINFELETDSDVISPLTVANALVENPNIVDVTELEDIAKCLLVYTERCKQRCKEVSENIKQYRKKHNLD